MDDAAFARLTGQLERLLDIDLSAYKQQQMRRRVTTFVERQGGGDDIEAFTARLRAEPALLAALRDMLTINVTEFFRDAPQWQQLERTVLPALLADRRALRVWSAGCSHGQEPLSLAIVLDRLGALDRARIVATDFDRAALGRTRAGGPYREEEMGGVTRADRLRYFERRDGGCVAVPRLRARTQCRELNLLRDAFDADFDLVVCRNVMIYFENDVKAALIRRFFEALRPGGVLFIGATEALIGRDVDGFERLGGNFYRRARAQVEPRRAA